MGHYYFNLWPLMGVREIESRYVRVIAKCMLGWSDVRKALRSRLRTTPVSIHTAGVSAPLILLLALKLSFALADRAPLLMNCFRGPQERFPYGLVPFCQLG